MTASIYRRGKVYWGRWRDAHGVLHRESLGTKVRPEAERLLAQKLGSLGHVVSVERLFDRWLDEKQRHHAEKRRSVEAFTIAARRFTLRWGDRPPSALSREDVESFKRDRLAEGIAPTTINNDLNMLRNALRFGVERGLIESAPNVVPLRAAKRRVPKYLSDQQLRAILSACRGDRLEPVLRLAYECGLRASEIIWINWGDVDLTNGWVHVTAKLEWSPKSHAERSVPIREEFAEWLKRYRERLEFSRDADPVCQKEPGVRWDRGLLGQKVAKLFRDLGVKVPGARHTLHLLRGTYATRFLRGGGDLESLRDNLGHADLKTTASYLSATDESKRRGLEGLELPE